VQDSIAPSVFLFNGNNGAAYPSGELRSFSGFSVWTDRAGRGHGFNMLQRWKYGQGFVMFLLFQKCCTHNQVIMLLLLLLSLLW
jgi:hypothetical protein